MTEEQKQARKVSAESGNIRWIKDNCLRTKDGDDDYVFISYKSDDFEKVLDDIVYNVCRNYGLKVYFDTAFDEDSDSWITQYYDNMCDPKCKAFIAFLDDAYYSSYACLLEMMSRKTAAAGGDYKEDSLFFLPVNIGSISDIVDNSNTGLGTKRYSNGKINSHADEELERFNEIFSEVADDFMRKSVYKREKDTQLYEEATAQSGRYGKMYLSITQCRRLMERVVPKKNDNDGGNKAFVDVIHDKLVKANITSVFGKCSSSEKCNVHFISDDAVEKAENESESDHRNPYKDGYVYTIFGKEYRAGKREQGKLMYDAFEALIERYPDKVESLTAQTSVARAEDVTDANTQQAQPPYFRGCKKYSVGKKEYYVGTSYGFGAKIEEIKRMFKICGADAGEFVLNGAPLEEKASRKKISDDNKNCNSAGCFKYKLWNELYAADRLADMMHDVFDLIAEKYPDKIIGMANNDRISAVALKSDVDEEKLPASKLNYFKAKREHKVGNELYYMSTRYGREQGIDQLEKMVLFCEGATDSFEVLSMPEKSSHSGGGKR